MSPSLHSAPKRVLVVQYAFYPAYSVGVKQVAKYCKYLPRFGWEPIVLTKDWERDVAPEDAPFVAAHEPGREAVDIGYSVRVLRAPYHVHSNALLRLHARLQAHSGSPRSLRIRVLARKMLSAIYPTFGRYPDAFVGWVDAAVAEGERAAREFDVDAILSVCPPQSAHLVASRIARRLRIPWVAHFGDLYGFYVGPGDWHGTRWRRALALALNKRWMRPAARAAAVSPAMLEYVSRTYGAGGDVVVVGFDPDETAPDAVAEPSAKFVLAHTGSIYVGDQRADLLFDALDLLLTRRPSIARELDVHLVGSRCESTLREMLAGRPARNVCTIVERVSAEESLALQRSASALLILNLTRVATGGTLSYPSKVFEYLAARRPILALPSDSGGFLDRLIEETGAGVVAPDAAAAGSVLERWIDEWRATGRVAYGGVPASIARFGYDAQTGRLAKLLDEAVGIPSATEEERPEAIA